MRRASWVLLGGAFLLLATLGGAWLWLTHLARAQAAAPRATPVTTPVTLAPYACSATSDAWCYGAQLWRGGDTTDAFTPSRSGYGEVPSRPRQALPLVPTAQRVTVLVLGLDTEDDTGSSARTDVVLLLTLDRAANRAGMLSLPRDLWLPIPGHANDRINTAYALGGPALAVETVEYNLGVTIDHYAVVNFAGFVELVDLVGGIEVYLDTPLDDPYYLGADGELAPLHIPAGLQHFDGDMALRYVRTRHAAGGDLARAQRQQQVLLALLERVRQMEQLPDLLRRAPELYATFSEMVQTDLSLPQLLGLANEATRLDQSVLQARVLGAACVEPWTTPTGGQVLLPVWEEIRAARDAVFGTPEP